MQPKGFDTLDGPTPIPTRIVRCLTALAHFAQCKPHKIVNGVGGVHLLDVALSVELEAYGRRIRGRIAVGAGAGLITPETPGSRGAVSWCAMGRACGTAVNHDLRAVDVRGIVRGEEQNGSRDLFSFT